MSIRNEDILSALSEVQDPDLKKDLVSLSMVKDIKIDGKKVFFTVVLTTPACPLKEKIKQDCIAAIEKKIGTDYQLFPNMTADVTSLKNSSELLPHVKNIIAVGSGKGGVGKSTVTSNLAIALMKSGAKVGIIDADIYGPSIPTMFNAENARPGIAAINGKNVIIPIEQYGIKLLSIGFLAPPEEAVVWRGPMASTAFRQFFTDTDWGELDYLLIDLPPGTSDIHLTMVQTVPVTGAVIVTTPQKVALADAQKAISMFQMKQVNVPILGLVENMAYFTPEELPNNKYYIFGQDGGKILASRNEIPYLGEVPLVQSVRESADNGKPEALRNTITAEAFTKIAEQLARNVAMRNANTDASPLHVEVKSIRI